MRRVVGVGAGAGGGRMTRERITRPTPPAAERNPVLERTTVTEWAHHIEAGISSLLETPVHVVMRHGCASVSDRISAESLAEHFIEHGLDEALVLDGHGRLRGVITAADLLAEREDERELQAETRVVRPVGLDAALHTEPEPLVAEDILRPAPLTLPEAVPLAKGLMLLAAYELAHAPVVDEDGHVCGVLYAADALAWVLEQRGLPRLARPRPGRDQH